MPFKFIKTKIADVTVIEPPIFSDSRGFFIELFKSTDFKGTATAGAFTQVSHSSSGKNVLRGLHYQLNPKAQARMVRVLRGEIFDVAVDLRRSSPTFGHWVGERLSRSNNRMLLIPEGFAHGFCVLSDEAELLYICTGEYAPESERTVLWNDPAVGIFWPIKDPVLSAKDSKGVPLSAAEVYP